MATAAEMTQLADSATDASASNTLVFTGPRKNLVTGMAMTITGLAAFSMGMTETFFVEAMAWTFLIWGVLFIYSNLMEMNETYTLTDETLTITNAFRFWGQKRVWDWSHISRVDATIKRNDPIAEDVKAQVYYTPPEQPGVLNRVDVAFSPEMFQAILDRAGLKADKGNTFADLNSIPQDSPGTYIWKG